MIYVLIILFHKNNIVTTTTMDIPIISQNDDDSFDEENGMKNHNGDLNQVTTMHCITQDGFEGNETDEDSDDDHKKKENDFEDEVMENNIENDNEIDTTFNNNVKEAETKKIIALKWNKKAEKPRKVKVRTHYRRKNRHQQHPNLPGIGLFRVIFPWSRPRIPLWHIPSTSRT